MNRPTDCEAFHEQLDALVDGRLPDDGLEQLRRHAASCADCAMQLRIHEHLASPSLREVEAMVPDELAETVLPRVQREVAMQSGGPHARRSTWPGRLVPALAAATLLLCVGSGALFWEMGQLRDRETELVRQVTEQGRRLAQLDARTSMDPVARAANVAGRSSWEWALARRRTVTLAELVELLKSAPASTTIFSSTEAAAFTEALPMGMASLMAEALAALDTNDGIQIGEVLDVIDGLKLDVERRISTSRLLAVSRNAARLGRS